MHSWVEVSCAVLYGSDGVHLSPVGVDLLLNDWQEALERVAWRDAHWSQLCVGGVAQGQ